MAVSSCRSPSAVHVQVAVAVNVAVHDHVHDHVHVASVGPITGTRS